MVRAVNLDGFNKMETDVSEILRIIDARTVGSSQSSEVLSVGSSGLLNIGATPSRLRTTGGLYASLVGDSIESSYFTPGSGVTLGNLGEHNMLVWAERWSLGKFQVGQNLAVFGTRLAAHIIQADNVDSSVTPIVIENGGSNDLVGANATVSYCLTQKKLLWEKLRAKGCEIVSLSVLPVGAADGGSFANNQKIAAFNAACDTLAASYGVRRVDIYSLFVDPANANGYPLADRMWDVTHPSVKGAYYGGAKIWSVLSGMLGGQDYQLASGACDSYTAGTNNNVWCENVLFAGTGGSKNGQGGTGVSGTVADNWDVSIPTLGTATAVCSLVADPDGFGQALQIVITATAAGDRIELRRLLTALGPVTLDSLVSAEIVCRVVAGTNVGAVVPWNLIQVDGVNNFMYGGSGSNSPTPYLNGNTPAENKPWLLRVPTCNANNLARTGAVLNAIRLFVGIYMTAAGNATILFSRARGRKVVTS